MENYNIGFVYKITSPKGRIYIGSTDNIKRRKYQYEKNYFKAQRKVYRSINKYGWELHKFEVIWEGDIQYMLKKEAELGQLFSVLHKDNLNLMLPKLNDIYSSISEETRLKMSNSAKGKIISESHKEIIRKTHTGKIVSEETRKNMSTWQIGRKMSE